MNAKEMLQSAYSLHCAILIKQEQISIIEDSITNITVSLDKERVSRSPDPSSMQTAIVQLIELKEEVEVDIARLTDIEQKSRRLINQVSNVGSIPATLYVSGSFPDIDPFGRFCGKHSQYPGSA